jgi:pyruvate dehydrogenase E1 component alpha subunit
MIRYHYKGSGFQKWDKSTSGYSKDFLLQQYRDMLRIRMIEEEIERRYHEDQMKTPIHLVIGQEASVVGSCAALKITDLALCGHRTHGVYLAKGGDLKAMMSELYCRINGCAASRGGSMHLFDKSVGMLYSSAIVGGAVPIATGAALSAKMRKQDQVTALYFGDAAVEEGVMWESINFAALKKLPIIFFCENNFYSVCSSLETRQPPNVEIYKKAEAFGIPSVQIDGNNVLEVYEATKNAVEHARKQNGPVFIEAICYRYRGHGGAGDDSATGYRDPAEVKEWQQYDPIEMYYQYLLGLQIITPQHVERLRVEIMEEIMQAFEHAISSPNPTEADLYTHVYAD